MHDLTEFKIFLASILRPIIYEAIKEQLHQQSTQVTIAPAADPYGDFNWLTATCSGIPASTLRIKSAAGEIPGVVKVGRRVLYEKAAVLHWLRSRQIVIPSAEQVEQAAQAQVNAQLEKRSPKARSARSNRFP